MSSSSSDGEILEGLDFLLLSDADLSSVLQRVAGLSVQHVAGCDHAGVTIRIAGPPRTAAATDDTTLAIDHAQYESGTGPCLDCYRHKMVVRIDEIDVDERYPAFRDQALEVGVHSSLSLPLEAGGHAVGALNLYSEMVDAFDHTAEASGLQFARHAAVLVANVETYDEARATVGHLETAMSTRAVIEQATGMIMLQRRCGPDQAFDVLRELSQHQNRKLRDVAAEVVAELSTRTPGRAIPDRDPGQAHRPESPGLGASPRLVAGQCGGGRARC